MHETENIMTTDLVCVNRFTGIFEAIETLVENNVTGLPVVNDDMTLAGILTEKDVLGLLAVLHDESARVEDYMTEFVVSFDQEENFIAICECLTNNHFRRVPIVSHDKVVGIISRRDLINYISEPI